MTKLLLHRGIDITLKDFSATTAAEMAAKFSKGRAQRILRQAERQLRR